MFANHYLKTQPHDFLFILSINQYKTFKASVSTNTNAGASHTSRGGPSGCRMGKTQGERQGLEGALSLLVSRHSCGTVTNHWSNCLSNVRILRGWTSLEAGAPTSPTWWHENDLPQAVEMCTSLTLVLWVLNLSVCQQENLGATMVRSRGICPMQCASSAIPWKQTPRYMVSASQTPLIRNSNP